MANINLLPEQMREKEAKEVAKVARRPKSFDVELSRTQADPNKPIKQIKPSFWSKFKRNKKIKPVTVSTGAKVPKSNANVDFLQAPKNKEITATPVSMPVKSTKKKNIWSAVGPAKSPIKPLPVAKNIDAVKPKEREAEIKKPVKTEIKYNTVKPTKKRSFISRLKSLFSRKKKDQIPVAPSPQKPIKQKEKNKKFHLAPKAVRARFDINLVPEELIFRKYPKTKGQIITILIAIIIPALIVGGLYFIVDEQQKLIDNKMAQLNEDRADLIEYIDRFRIIQKENIRLQDKLLAIKDLLEKHTYWTKFFSLLERYTLDEIYYTQFSADTSGVFVLPAVASAKDPKSTEEQVSESYRKAANQIIALSQADDFVDEVRVDGMEIVSTSEAGIEGVKFNINVILTNGVFTK